MVWIMRYPLVPEPLGVPPGLVAAEAAGEVPLQEEGDGEVELGGGVVRLEGEGAREGGLRLVHPPQLLEGIPQVVVGLGEAGLEGERPLVQRQRVREPAQFLNDGPQVVQGLGVLGPGSASIALEMWRIARPYLPVWEAITPRRWFASV